MTESQMTQARRHNYQMIAIILFIIIVIIILIITSAYVKYK